MIVCPCYVNLVDLTGTRVYFIALVLVSVRLLLFIYETVFVHDIASFGTMTNDLTVISELIPHWLLFESSRQGPGRFDNQLWVYC